MPYSSSLVPEDAASMFPPRSETMLLNMNSAIGERQIFPRQTNIIFFFLLIILYHHSFG